MPIGLGIGLNISMRGGLGSGFSLTAPDPVEWVSGVNVAQAVFAVTPDPAVEALMRVYGEVSATSNFAVILETTFAVIESPDFDDLQIDDFAFSPFTSGTYYARFWTATSAGVQNSPKSASVTKTLDVDAPTITSANSANNAENSVLAHSLTANESVTWTITGGADAAEFEISGSTLRWASNGTQDYETPGDDGTNNTYVVQVTATDAATNATNQTVTITVTDVSDTGTTLNPSDKGAAITLSGGDLIATKASGASDQLARSIASKTSGKHYWEITINAGTAYPGLGIATSSHSLTAFLGANTHGCGYFKTGAVTINSATAATIQTFANGDVVCVALDMDNGKIWFRTNGGNWNNAVIGSQNPATNTGGINIAGMAAGAKFAAVNLSATNDQVTANFGGSAFAQTPPSGFAGLA